MGSMTGLVTEMGGTAGAVSSKGGRIFLDELESRLADKEFVSYSDVMEELGVPKSAYEYSRTRLRNGKTVFYTDPQLGWGRNGFGYYIVTFIEATDD